MAHKANLVRHEHMTDEQYASVSRMFECIIRMKAKLRAKKLALAKPGQSPLEVCHD